MVGKAPGLHCSSWKHRQQMFLYAIRVLWMKVKLETLHAPRMSHFPCWEVVLPTSVCSWTVEMWKLPGRYEEDGLYFIAQSLNNANLPRRELTQHHMNEAWGVIIWNNVPDLRVIVTGLQVHLFVFPMFTVKEGSVFLMVSITEHDGQVVKLSKRRQFWYSSLFVLCRITCVLRCTLHASQADIK